MRSDRSPAPAGAAPSPQGGGGGWSAGTLSESGKIRRMQDNPLMGFGAASKEGRLNEHGDIVLSEQDLDGPPLPSRSGQRW